MRKFFKCNDDDEEEKKKKRKKKKKKRKKEKEKLEKKKDYLLYKIPKGTLPSTHPFLLHPPIIFLIWCIMKLCPFTLSSKYSRRPLTNGSETWVVKMEESEVA